MADIKGREIKVHEHGFVRVVDTMGDDAAIVQAARVSYGEGTKTVNEDAGLLKYLMKHKHSSPFEMNEIKIHVKLPIFVARQWIRHRTANVNEVSGRYSVLPSEYYTPDTWHAQSKDNKQGSGEALDAELQGRKSHGYWSLMMDTFEWYERSGDRLAREQARMVLPLSTYTEMYWKIDLSNLFHFLRLRADGHAQKEIRDYADAISSLVEEWCPLAFAAWVEYQRDAVTLSAGQVEMVKALVKHLELTQPAYSIGDVPDTASTFLAHKAGSISRRDRQELEKLFA